MANKLKKNRFMGENIGKKPVAHVEGRNNLWLMVGGAISLCIIVLFVSSWFIARNAPEPNPFAGQWDDVPPFEGAPYSSIPILSSVDGSTIVATVNGIGITAADVHIRLNQAENMLQWDFFEETGSFEINYNAPFRGGTFGDAVRAEAVHMAAEDIIRQHYALENNIVLNAEEIAAANTELLQFEAMMGGAQNFHNIIRAEGFTGAEHFLNLLQTEALINRTIDTVLGNPQLFAQFEEFLPEEIDSTELANELLLRARAGEDFDMLVQEYGQDPGMFNNPEGYTFITGTMVPEFYEATKNLAIGEISDLVPSMHGYHIIKRIEPDTNNVMTPHGVRVATADDYVLAAKHILIQFDPHFGTEPRILAIMAGFNYMISNAEIEHLPELQNIVMGRL